MDFDADYAGYSERYHGSLQINESADHLVRVGGRNDRITEDITSRVQRSVERSAPFDARRAGPNRSISVPESQHGIADQIFDYDSLLSLLPSPSQRNGISTWRASTKAWASNAVTTDVPVLIRIRRHNDVSTLTAIGHKRCAVTSTGDPVIADLRVNIVAVFRNGVLIQSQTRAYETYERHGTPAGGGTYSLIVRLKGSTS
jgi:hypothetical protein